MIKTLHIVRLFLAGLLASFALGAHAQLSIEITGTGASRFKVIIPIFENEGRLPQSVTDVVRADLEAQRPVHAHRHRPAADARIGDARPRRRGARAAPTRCSPAASSR